MTGSKLKPILAAIAMVVIVAAVGIGLYVYKTQKMKHGEGHGGGEPPMAVTIVAAKVIDWQPTTDLVGTVIALRSVALQNEVEGLVTFVGFESGDIIEPGHVMVKLDDRTDRAELASAEAALRVAEAELAVTETQLALARQELQRQESAQAATAAIEVDRARAVAERMAAEKTRSEASIEEARARIEEVKVRLDKRVIRAPFKARVGIRTVHEGQFLAQPMGTDSGPIATLQEIADRIYIDFAVPQEYLPRITVGMSVAGELDSVGGVQRRPIELTVAAIDATANTGTRNIRVRATVDNRDDSLRPGMFVKIRVPIDNVRSFVTVPVTAVRRASYADQVFVVVPGEQAGPNGMPSLRASQRFVRLGPTIGDDVIVLEGVKEGDQVAAAGSFKLREGAPVMPAMAGGPGGPPSGPGGPPGAGGPPAGDGPGVADHAGESASKAPAGEAPASDHAASK